MIFKNGLKPVKSGRNGCWKRKTPAAKLPGNPDDRMNVKIIGLYSSKMNQLSFDLNIYNDFISASNTNIPIII